MPKELATDSPQPLCRSADLVEAGLALPFEVVYAGQTCRAFAVRFEGQPQAYLNRCSHVAMELDWPPNQVFDDSGQWLLCAMHGAAYHPETGECAGGPCRGGLVKINLSEHHDVVFWKPNYKLQPIAF
jgi:nitrite reductase/ring-hydroxylating ferredoxin subunit